MRLISTILICVGLAAPVSAKPHLRDVREIDDPLMMIAIADEIRKSCDGIQARMFRAIGQINALEAKAKSMGYSAQEIDDYVTSKSEKARMRGKAEGWLASQGVPAGDTGALCAFGEAQIRQNSYIGSLLR